MYGAMGLFYLDGRLSHREGRIKTVLLGGRPLLAASYLDD
jgi:hypothetical protein